MLSEQFDRTIITGLDYARFTSEAKGLSFDVYTYLVSQLGEYAVGQFNDYFIEQVAREDMLNDGAADLMADLALGGYPFGFLTTGGEKWQELKLKASQLDHVPYNIISQSRKGEIIATWQNNGKFEVPAELHANGGSVVYDRVVLVDDKPISFDGLPDGAEGLLYVKGGRSSKLPNVYYDLPGSIQVIADLRQVRGYVQADDLLMLDDRAVTV